MTADNVLSMPALLRKTGADVWIAGGWGIDARMAGDSEWGRR